MASFSGQTKNSNIDYFGPDGNDSFKIYCFVKYSGTPNETERYVDTYFELVVYYKYTHQFGFGNNGTSNVTIAGEKLVDNDVIRYDGTGEEVIWTGTKRLYYDKDGNITNNSIYVKLTNKKVYSKYWSDKYGKDTYYKIEMELDTTLDKISSIPPDYTAPSLYLNPNNNTKIGIVGSSSYSVNYALTKGTDTIIYTRACLFNYDTKAFIWDIDFGRTATNSGYWDSFVLPGSYFAHGSRYRLSMSTYDNKNEIWSPDYPPGGGSGVTIYTYQKPSLSTSVSYHQYRTANQDNTFTLSGINNRAWSSYENDFQTHYRIKRGSANYTDWVNLGNISAWYRSASDMRSLVPKSYDNTDCTIQFRRYSPSAGWVSDNTSSAVINVSYRPQAGVTTGNIGLRQNNSGGSGISQGQFVANNSSLTHIYVYWSYNTDAYASGYTQGYRIRLYNSAGTVVKTYYTSNKYYSIPKGDIPKIQNTYIDITPYYCNDSSDVNSYWYFNGTIQKASFVYMVGTLETPIITYPVQNTNWINNQFRICFRLPNDPDKGSETETYHYEDIEVKINGNFTIKMKDSTGGTTTGTVRKAPECFSSLQSDLTYQKYIVVNPSLASGFPITSSYTIQVRVKKKYGNSTNVSTWSAWSSTRNITVSIPSFGVNIGDKVLASHYNAMRTILNNIKTAYGVSFTLPNTVTSRSTKILKSQFNYNNVYKLLVDTKNKINSYATFDGSRSNVKIDNGGSLAESFTPATEYITAEANENNSPNGRNYIKILYNRLAYLK